MNYLAGDYDEQEFERAVKHQLLQLDVNNSAISIMEEPEFLRKKEKVLKSQKNLPYKLNRIYEICKNCHCLTPVFLEFMESKTEKDDIEKTINQEFSVVSIRQMKKTYYLQKSDTKKINNIKRLNLEDFMEKSREEKKASPELFRMEDGTEKNDFGIFGIVQGCDQQNLRSMIFSTIISNIYNLDRHSRSLTVYNRELPINHKRMILSTFSYNFQQKKKKKIEKVKDEVEQMETISEGTSLTEPTTEMLESKMETIRLEPMEKVEKRNDLKLNIENFIRPKILDDPDLQIEELAENTSAVERNRRITLCLMLDNEVDLQSIINEKRSVNRLKIIQIISDIKPYPIKLITNYENSQSDSIDTANFEIDKNDQITKCTIVTKFGKTIVTLNGADETGSMRTKVITTSRVAETAFCEILRPEMAT